MILTASYSDIGGRACNEDSVRIVTKGDDQVCVLVADGLGGHGGGAQASGAVADTICAMWQKAQPGVDMECMVQCAHQAVLKLQTSQCAMKSTVVVLALNQGFAEWAHVGDSRLYFLTGGRIYQLTEDHSVTYKKFRAGEITRMQINFDEDRPSLLRAVGDVNHCVPDVAGSDVPLCPGDAFMLCSDGFWEYLYEEEILVDSLKAETAQEWMEQMLLRVMERVRPDTDNLTAMTIFLR